MLGAKYKKDDRVVYVSDPLVLKRLEERAKLIHKRGGMPYDPNLMPWDKLNYAEGAVQCIHHFYMNGNAWLLYTVLFDDEDVNRLLDCPSQLFLTSELMPVVTDFNTTEATPP